MNSMQNVHSDPIFEHISSDNVTIKSIFTEDTQHCALCGAESNSLYIYTFSQFLCEPCFKFALSTGH